MLFRSRGASGAPVAAPDSPVWKVLHDEPNADQTPVDFVEFLVVSLLMRGNFYARKVMDGARLVSLEPIRPDIVEVRRGADGALRYRWGSPDGPVDLGEDEVFHVRGFGGGPLGVGLRGSQHSGDGGRMRGEVRFFLHGRHCA